jgi:malate dehydrogenase
MRKRVKITIIGAGHVGETCAQVASTKELGDLVLVDIIEGMPQGKALDMFESSPVTGFDCQLVGANDYDATADSDIVIITSGLARKPGMSRDELLEANTKIVAEVTRQAVARSPNSILLVVSNPLDAMVYVAYKVSGFPTHRVVGQAGILDTARFRAFIGMELNCSVEDIQTMILGGHGDDMVPLPRYSSVSGIPLLDLIPKERMDAIVQRTRMGGGEIVKLLKTGSAYYAPAAATIQMAEAMVKDKRRILPCAAYCNKEYKVGGYFVGVPAMLGVKGVEKVIELKLTDEERKLFEGSVQHVRDLVAQTEKLLTK